MLTDYWVISLLLGQLCSLTLLTGAVLLSNQMIRKWSAGSFDELQLQLERRSYLVGSIVHFVLIFQIASLFMFLHVANHHLTEVIKGAMCADGALGVNSFGENLLYLKMGAVLVYIVYLFLNYLDNSEPAYPLTPLKYWLIYPIFGLIALDLVWMVLFFYNIEPDVIATCCSVKFVASGAEGYFSLFASRFTTGWLVLFGVSGSALLLLLFFFQRFSWLKLLTGGVFITSAIFSLKYFFVKYIYGLPSHNCLYDIFWAKYYFVGYIFFGGYYTLAASLICLVLLQLFKARLGDLHPQLAQKLHWISFWVTLILIALPLAFWWHWDGNL